MKKGISTASLVVMGITAMSSVLFVGQGGFGGGHGDFDTVIFVLGLPWAGIPWPAFLTKHDFVWLIGLPFTLNMLSITLVAGWRRH